jgi:hypothetical protein
MADNEQDLPIRPGMTVVGSDGADIGTVERIRRDQIILSAEDSDDELQHAIPLDWVERVSDDVQLDRSADEAMEEWEELA